MHITEVEMSAGRYHQIAVEKGDPEARTHPAFRSEGAKLMDKSWKTQ